MDSNRVHAVQVIADSERAGTEVVFEKESDNKPEPKQLNISPIESAAFCGTMADYYGFGSRRTIGRVMRAYLDEYGLSALELVFDAAHLMMLYATTSCVWRPFNVSRNCRLNKARPIPSTGPTLFIKRWKR